MSSNIIKCYISYYLTTILAYVNLEWAIKIMDRLEKTKMNVLDHNYVKYEDSELCGHDKNLSLLICTVGRRIGLLNEYIKMC